MSGEWRDISTAPKDGECLVYWTCESSGTGCISIARNGAQWWLSIDDGAILPTHWQHLPAPPTDGT